MPRAPVPAPSYLWIAFPNQWQILFLLRQFAHDSYGIRIEIV